MDSPKTGNGLPVIGPGPDIGNYDSANILSDGYCPACREKGKLKTLKTYRISFQESVYLCEELQCIYPLGSKSYNNLISPDLEDHLAPNKPHKRNLLEISCKDSPLTDSKEIKSYSVIDGEQVLNSKYNGEEFEETSSDLTDSLHSGQQSPVRATDLLGPDEILETVVTDVAAKDDASAVDISGTGETVPHNEGGTSELEMSQEDRCSLFCQTSCVQWRNSDALCWLDCLLSLLVHLEVVKKTVMTDLCSNEESLFWQLFTKYNQASKLLHASHLDAVRDRDFTKLISVFERIETCLNEVRSKIFIRIQPQLGCTLGDMESPVIAFPLILGIEACIEKLFTYSFSWNFECSQCGHKYQTSCTKNLVTFTDLVPEWHPLNAAHFSPCGNCNNKSQIRKMVLKEMSPIFMLHFVQGLPHTNFQHYSFLFEGCFYQITSVIQYHANNHFITWILCVDGSWLECDDLKGPCCKRYKEFECPASEIHIVIWERKTAQMTDKKSACPSLQKTNDQHAFSDETQPPPAVHFMGDASSAEKPSGTASQNTSVTPNTLCQDKAVAHQPHLLSVPKGLIGNDIMPSTLEKVQANSEGFLLENTPVAENGVVIKTNTLQPQESLMASLVSVPCKEKFIQDQFVDLRFPSPIISTSMQSIQSNSENTIITNSMTNVHATDPIQGVKSVEIEGTVALEKDVPVNHFLSPKTEKLKTEQHVTSQISNLKRKFSQTIAESSQNPSQKENLKKPFMGSWVKGLLSKGASFLPPCVSAHNRNAITDLQHSVKGASNFGGYKTKGVNQKAHRASRKPRASKPSPASNPPPSLPSSGSVASSHADVNADLEVLKKHENASYGVHLNHRSGGNENGVSLANHEDSSEDQIHKLRLKLLKKLKAKKKKLAALMSSPQHGKLPSENLEHVSHCGSPNDGQSIEDVLKELQYQIGITDNKYGRTTAASVSSYSGQTHEEILAELLSPTVCTELSENRETDFRYLEMENNHIPAPVPTELNGILPNTHLRQEHNYCSPTKKNLCQVQPNPVTNNECDRTLNLESSLKTDVFDEFFSTSALNSLANDTLDLPFFDDYLFESC
uniref:Ubiquitin specific peptidase like 1 n=1 Tax=Pipistrellus kuhlii TaxID=59472 RepID=A0A7J7ZN81_PIPKU|nr:ubiquitin specific peptidase like 1 [Pipistrellus kuhlii]